MGATRTLAQLRDGTRRYADFIASGSAEPVYSNVDINQFINDAISEYYEKLVAARGHEYFLASTTIAIVGGTPTYTLPATFFELSALILEWDTQYHELVRPLDSQLHRPLLNNQQVWARGSNKAYRISSIQDGTQTIELLPTPGSAVTGRLRYIPTFAPLVGDGAVMFIVNGFDKLVMAAAAVEMRMIKGLPVDQMTKLRDEQIVRLEEMAAERLADQPARIVDVYPEQTGSSPWPPPYFAV